MLVYRYSGTLDGFLSVVFDSYTTRRRADDIIPFQSDAQLPLICEFVDVEDHVGHAERVENGLIRACGVDAIQHLLYGFASSDLDKAIILYRWVLCVFQYGTDVKQMYAHPDVLNFQRMESRVTLEFHHMLGFLRFRELSNGLLYAEISPDHDIMSFLMPHFVDRYPQESFIIRDVGRRLFGLYNGHEWMIEEQDKMFRVQFSDAEKMFSDLWKDYYQFVSIASRTNTRLRNNWMPRRYWHHLVEFVN